MPRFKQSDPSASGAPLSMAKHIASSIPQRASGALNVTNAMVSYADPLACTNSEAADALTDR